MNDEKIGAFMDREGEENERAALAKAIEASSGATMRLRIFKKADAVLRQAMPASVSQNDHALSQRILNADPIRQSTPVRLMRLAAPLAAACVLGLALGWMSADTSARFSLAHLDTDIASALDSTPSGETQAIRGGEVTLALTYQTQTGAYCRQFRLSTAQETTQAIACRDQSGWNVVVAAAEPDANNNSYHLAGAGGDPLDAALAAMGEGSVVDEAEEEALLRAHWQPAE
jgi:hypothetical protein